jgi:hypothetical protein
LGELGFSVLNEGGYDSEGDGPQLYGFVGNNPINAIDPLGLRKKIPCTADLYRKCDNYCFARRKTQNRTKTVCYESELRIGPVGCVFQDADCACEDTGNGFTCKCKKRTTGDNPPAHCPDFVYGSGKNMNDCMNSAKNTAPPECRKYYGHCEKRQTN